VTIEKRLAAKKKKLMEAKKRNQQTEAFVRQLLKDDKADKLDSFKDILSQRRKRVQRRRRWTQRGPRRRWTSALVLQMSALPIPVP
jgi:hypothetical protein